MGNACHTLGLYKVKTAKQLAINKRHLRLTGNDQVIIHKIKKQLLLLIHCDLNNTRNDEDDEVDVDELRDLIQLFTIKYFSLAYRFNEITDSGLARIWRNLINDFSDSDCLLFFRFTKVQARELRRLLMFPLSIQLDNGIKISGEEVMLRGLYELVSGETKHNISANVFGRDNTAQTRAFNWFTEHTYLHAKRLLYNNLKWWYDNGFFEKSAEVYA